MDKILILMLAMAFDIVLALITAIPGGVVLMWAAEWVHENFLPAVVPAGYLASYTLAVLVGALVAVLSPSTSSKS